MCSHEAVPGKRPELYSPMLGKARSAVAVAEGVILPGYTSGKRKKKILKVKFCERKSYMAMLETMPPACNLFTAAKSLLSLDTLCIIRCLDWLQSHPAS